MYSNRGITIKRVGKVTIQKQRNSIRLRFTYQNKQRSITIGSYSKENLQAAIARAKEIDSDIAWMRFDSSLIKYGRKLPKQESNALESEKEANEVTIRDIWENYLKIRGDQLAASSKRTLKPVDKWLDAIPSNLLGISHCDSHIETLKELYSKTTINTIFRTFRAACNLAVKSKMIESNPYEVYNQSLIFSTKGERSCKPFEDWEIPIILEAFKTDRFITNQYKHSYYYPFVLFLTLTGCRPEDAIALTKSDIFTSNGRKVIRFSKSYSSGVVSTTKTKTIRLFPVNQQLQECLNLAPGYQNNEVSLVFPSQQNSYLDLHNFTNRYFTPVVKELVKLGEIENQLPTYHLRHTFITQMIRKGIDIATIANLVGNSPETILNNYLGSNAGIELPDLSI